MNFYEQFKQIEEEFGEEMAVLCVCALSVQLSTKVTNDDLLKRGQFTKKITKKITDVLWEHSTQVPEVLKVIDAIYDFEIRKQMNGLGGCVQKSLKEIIQEKRT